MVGYLDDGGWGCSSSLVSYGALATSTSPNVPCDVPPCRCRTPAAVAALLLLLLVVVVLTEFSYQGGDWLLFGAETTGLPMQGAQGQQNERTLWVVCAGVCAHSELWFDGAWCS